MRGQRDRKTMGQDSMIKEKKFREDLFYRISTFTIIVPPLRERLEDIDDLAKHFLEFFLIVNKLAQKEFSANALEKLKSWSYPGNVRELAKIVKNAAIFSGSEVICADDIDFQSATNQDDIWNKKT
jgi:transcriptional regulator with GAF, ATPase, and Fis domain